MNPKTDTRHARLSGRYSIDITMTLDGRAMTCEWDPRPPSHLSTVELAAYRNARDGLLAEIGAELGRNIVVLEI
jgi:hypothetical protein